MVNDTPCECWVPLSHAIFRSHYNLIIKVNLKSLNVMMHIYIYSLEYKRKTLEPKWYMQGDGNTDNWTTPTNTFHVRCMHSQLCAQMKTSCISNIEWTRWKTMNSEIDLIVTRRLCLGALSDFLLYSRLCGRITVNDWTESEAHQLTVNTLFKSCNTSGRDGGRLFFFAILCATHRLFIIHVVERFVWLMMWNLPHSRGGLTTHDRWLY